MGVGPDLLAFVLGAAVSLATSWVLVSRLERVGERLGLSEALLGMLAALAADTPEITSAVSALLHGDRSIGVGVVVGSNVFNLAALLGLSAVVAGRIALHRRAVLASGAVAAWIAFVTLGLTGGTIGPSVGLGAALAVFAPYLLLLGTHRSSPRRVPMPARWWGALRRAVDEEELELASAIRPRRGRPLDAAVAVVSMVVVVVASVTMERAGSGLGHHFSVPGVVTGGLVLAAVTSLPNVVAAVYLAGRGRGAATMSTALNSNSLNVVAGLLIPALALGVGRPTSLDRLVGGWYLGLTVVTLALAYAHRGLRRGAGWLVIAGYLAFVGVLLGLS